jgi:hypothetical protein
MEEFIKRRMLISINFYRYFAGNINKVYFHSASEYRELFITDMSFPKWLKELFNLKLDLRARLFVPIY